MADLEQALFDSVWAAVTALTEVDAGRITRFDMSPVLDEQTIAPAIVVNYGQAKLEPFETSGSGAGLTSDFDEGYHSVEVDLWVPATEDFIDEYPKLRQAVRRALAALVTDVYSLTITRSTRVVLDGRTLPYTRTVYTLGGQED